MTTIGECNDCPSGYFCSNRGATEPAGMCRQGHICYARALIEDPVYNNDPSGNKTIITYGDLCHPGKYCPQGSSAMIDCPRGSYNPDRGGVSEALACKQCDPGKYCNGTALTAITGEAVLVDPALEVCSLWSAVAMFQTVRSVTSQSIFNVALEIGKSPDLKCIISNMKKPSMTCQIYYNIYGL